MVLGVMRIIAIYDWNVVFAGNLNKPFKIWNNPLGAFAF
jgi:hypothetical protein